MSPRKVARRAASRGTEEERALRAKLEQWMKKDVTCLTLARAIRRSQKTLHDAVSEETWRLYLALEEHHNARQLLIVDKLVALVSGRRR